MGLFRRSFDRPGDSPQAEAASIAGASMVGGEEAGLQEIRDALDDIQRIVIEVADRGTAQEKVFDVLHKELQEYKNDFIYEHLKPVLWPLLFLFDSLEQYAREIVQRVSSTNDPQLEAKEVLDHLKFFRGQLVEALRICEVTPMKQPSGFIDPKHHKGIGIEKIENSTEENTIRRVVRTGWFLNGKVLRHAEVIVGKTDEGIRAQQLAAQAAAQALNPAPVTEVAAAGARNGGSLLKAAETLLTSSDASAIGGGGGSS